MIMKTKYKILSSLLTFPAWRNAKYQHRRGAYCPSPMLLFYIPPCRKTFPAWRNVISQHGRRKKCSGTNRVFSHSQKCNFPEESFVLSTFCNSVALRSLYSSVNARGVKLCIWRRQKPVIRYFCEDLATLSNANLSNLFKKKNSDDWEPPKCD